MSKQTRREFLENSMLAAAATVAGSASIASAAPAKGSNSPIDRLRVAILGMNGRGKTHLGESLSASGEN